MRKIGNYYRDKKNQRQVSQEHDSYQEREMREIENHCWCEDNNHCDNKHDHKCRCKDSKDKDRDKDKDKDKKKDKARFADFEFFTLDPNVSVDNRFELPVDMQTPVASVTLDRVKSGDLVWLNGVFGLDNDDPNDFATIIMRVFRGTPSVFMAGQEIYRAVIEIDNEGNDDQVVEPLAHVDVITSDAKNVTYTVTLETDEDPVFLNGPVTFTAALIKKK